MRKDITVAAEPRTARGKNEMNRLRAAGKNPAVVYGGPTDAVAVAVEPRDIMQIMKSSTGHNTIFNLAIQGGETTPVMIIDWQHDPVKGGLIHVDMKRIDLAQRLKVKVPVHTLGDPKGVKLQGGQHEIVNREIEIECLPDAIPEYFEANVGEMMIGGSLRAADIQLGEGMTLVSDPTLVISHVVSTRTSETAAGADAAAPGAAEPEVIKKGKKEEEGADAKKAGDAKKK